MNWQTKHSMIVGALLVTLGLHLKNLQTWADVLTVGSLGEFLFQVGVTIGALLVGSPVARTPWTAEQRAAAAAVAAPAKKFLGLFVVVLLSGPAAG